MIKTLPDNFTWVTRVIQDAGGKPLMMVEALKEFGVHEGIDPHGSGGADAAHSNPKILSWAKEIGGSVADVYKGDAIAWCGLFMAVVAHRAGKELPHDPLWALNWGTFGNHTDTPMFGDVLCFVRHTPDGKTAGHVALYIAETDSTFFILGGNQGNEVCIEEIAKARLYTARRPVYAIAMPADVKRYHIDSSGKLSTDEA